MSETSEPQEETPKIGLAGFNNIGNTCFMNSGLQLIIHCFTILSFLLEDDDGNATYKDYLHKGGLRFIGEKIRKKNKIPDSQEVMVKRSDLNDFKENSFTQKLANIVKIIMKKGNSVITPREFKSVLENKFKIFQGRQQHDAHEFLINVIDTMYEETSVEGEPSINNIPDSINDYIDLVEQTKKELCQTTIIEEKRMILEKLSNFKKANREIINRYNGLLYIIQEYKKNYSPLISQLKVFLVHTYRCKNCGFENCKHAVDTIISLDVTSSIQQSFEKMCVDEVIDYTCSSCSVFGKAITNCKIYKTPLVLFVHLKRFEHLPNGKTRKDDTYVEIPKILDINPYCEQGMMSENNLSNRYTLIGISNHHGGMNYGHYTANCTGISDPENWYEFDDNRVSRWEGDKIDTGSAYIAMYQMIM
jgi:ubiquitin C-terminal hydrolase